MLKSEAEAREAIRLDPSLPRAYDILWQIEALKGNLTEAARIIEIEYRLDPLNPGSIQNLGMMYFIRGREAEAYEHWMRTIGKAPFETNVAMTQCYLSKGNLAEAWKSLRLAEELRPGEVLVLFLRGYLEALEGNRDQALAYAKSIRRLEVGEDSIQFIGYIHYALGDLDSFFRYLENAMEKHALDAINLIYNPLFENARTDPRYGRLITNLRARLWPMKDSASQSAP